MKEYRKSRSVSAYLRARYPKGKGGRTVFRERGCLASASVGEVPLRLQEKKRGNRIKKSPRGRGRMLEGRSMIGSGPLPLSRKRYRT